MNNIEYRGVDVAKLVFACLIPLLHISFKDSVEIELVRQYIARLGVPFFFAVSGMMLTHSIQKRGKYEALRRYAKRLASLLVIWLVIYSPILLVSMQDEPNVFQMLLFKTPAFLWYLTALLVASVPFCLIKSQYVLYFGSVLVYVWGTLMNGNYIWLTGGCAAYEQIFLTTRNGIFFALPFMCIGKLVINQNVSQKRTILWIGGVVALILLFLEITFVGTKISIGVDRSMYLMLPVVTYFLVRIILDINIPFDTQYFRGASSAIYLMQFGIITIMTYLLNKIRVEIQTESWLIYITLISVSCVLYWIIKNKRIVRHLF